MCEYAETAVLVAALDDNDNELRRRLADFNESELRGLLAAFDRVHDAIISERVRRLS